MKMASDSLDIGVSANKVEAGRLFAEGLDLHNRGDLDQASAFYEQVLRLCPDHHDAIHLLGVVASQRGDHQRACELIRRSVAINQRNSAAYVNLGTALGKLGELDEALECYDRAISLRPNDPEAHYFRGNVLRQLKRLEAAVESYVEAIGLRPDYASAYYDCGLTLHDLKEFGPALDCYEKVIQLGAADADLYDVRGLALGELGRFEEAIESHLRAVELKPDNARAHFHCGMAYRILGDHGRALLSYDRAIRLKPDFAEAYTNRGALLADLRQFDFAMRSYDKAIAVNPDFAPAYLNRGAILQQRGAYAEALAAYDKSLALNPESVESLINKGNVLGALHRYREAMETIDRAFALWPDNVEVQWNKSLLHLLTGDFETGWKLFESRWERGALMRGKRDFQQPKWSGEESLSGKTILVYNEQGFGDTIQFCRYVRLLADRGAKVVLEVRKPLVALLSKLDGVSRVIEEGGELPDFDYQSPLLSLPLAFGTTLETVPARVPYLAAEPEKARYWRDRLGSRTRPRVGLVWHGGAHKGSPEWRDANERRNIPLAKIAMLKLPEIDFFSLQKGDPAESELLERRGQVWPESNLFDFVSELQDFADTAALIDNLDLVVSVDTSTAHLAGAMGKPVWLLNRFDTCWRWMVDRDDSPWYPSMKIYRQKDSGDWDTVLSEVKRDLAGL